MKHRSFFRFLCSFVLFLYISSTAQAGQVISPADRTWAKEALSRQTQPAAAESSKSIAILNFHNRTGQKRLDALQKGMALLVINDLAKIDSVTVIERTKMQAVIDALQTGVEGSGLLDDSAALTAGKALQAYYMVNGAITEGALEQLEASAALIDVPFGNRIDLPNSAGPEQEFYRIQKDVTFHVIDALNIYLPAQLRRSLEVPSSASTTALLAFFLGIDHSDRGEYRQAAEMYTRALAEDPTLDLAREALQELEDLNLLAVAVEAPAAEEPKPIPPPQGKSEMSTGMKTGLAVAAVAGGVALLAAAGGGGGGGGDDTPPPPANENPTVAIDQTDVTCGADAVVFTFSEPMDTRFGYAESNDSSFTVNGSWLDVQHYRASWSGLDTFCSDTDAPESVRLTLTNFQAEDGAPLSGQTSFTLEFEDVAL
jgi:TolB-like protein